MLIGRCPFWAKVTTTVWLSVQQHPVVANTQPVFVLLPFSFLTSLLKSAGDGAGSRFPDEDPPAKPLAGFRFVFDFHLVGHGQRQRNMFDVTGDSQSGVRRWPDRETASCGSEAAPPNGAALACA